MLRVFPQPLDPTQAVEPLFSPLYLLPCAGGDAILDQVNRADIALDELLDRPEHDVELFVGVFEDRILVAFVKEPVHGGDHLVAFAACVGDAGRVEPGHRRLTLDHLRQRFDVERDGTATLDRRLGH